MNRLHELIVGFFPNLLAFAYMRFISTVFVWVAAANVAHGMMAQKDFLGGHASQDPVSTEEVDGGETTTQEDSIKDPKHEAANFMLNPTSSFRGGRRAMVASVVIGGLAAAGHRAYPEVGKFFMTRARNLYAQSAESDYVPPYITEDIENLDRSWPEFTEYDGNYFLAEHWSKWASDEERKALLAERSSVDWQAKLAQIPEFPNAQWTDMQTYWTQFAEVAYPRGREAATVTGGVVKELGKAVWNFPRNLKLLLSEEFSESEETRNREREERIQLHHHLLAGAIPDSVKLEELRRFHQWSRDLLSQDELKVLDQAIASREANMAEAETHESHA